MNKISFYIVDSIRICLALMYEYLHTRMKYFSLQTDEEYVDDNSRRRRKHSFLFLLLLSFY